MDEKTMLDRAENAQREHDAKVKMLQVFTTMQKPDERSECVVASTRETAKSGPIAENDKMRCIIVPEYSLSGTGIPSKYESIILKAIRDTAKEQLDSIWKAEPSVREVPAAIWSIDSLLLFSAREAESKRITKVTMTAYWQNSELRQKLIAKGDATLLKTWEQRIIGLAAPALTIGEDACNAIIATIGKCQRDLTHQLTAQLISKLENRIDTLRKQSEEVGEADF